VSRLWWESGGRQVFPAEFVAFVDDTSSGRAGL
jgi:hypothetical protein